MKYLYIFWNQNHTSASAQQWLFSMVLPSLPSSRFARPNSFIHCRA